MCTKVNKAHKQIRKRGAISSGQIEMCMNLSMSKLIKQSEVNLLIIKFFYVTIPIYSQCSGSYKHEAH